MVKTNKQILFERMYQVAGMPLNENEVSGSIVVDQGILTNMINKIVEKADYDLLNIVVDLLHNLNDGSKNSVIGGLSPQAQEALNNYIN